MRLTEKCDHDPGGECDHCLNGCERCGELEGLNDDCLCESCAFARLEHLADMAYERMKYE